MRWTSEIAGSRLRERQSIDRQGVGKLRSLSRVAGFELGHGQEVCATWGRGGFGLGWN
jgi:hypothetical protein